MGIIIPVHVLENCSPFTRSVIHLNDEHVETSENLNLVVSLYNLIEYSDNYEQTSGSLWQYKRDEQPLSVACNIENGTVDNSSSFKYKSNLLKELDTQGEGVGANAYRLYKNAQMIVPLKYLSSFFRSAEILFINAKLHIELNWTVLKKTVL